MPQFLTTICDWTFELASDYVKSIYYIGPVALSCDDTKLHPILRTYWDEAKECHFIVGTTGDLIAVEDEGLIRELVVSAKKDAATKV